MIEAGRVLSSQHRADPRHQHDSLASEGDGQGSRIAHTLTACCRCRSVSASSNIGPPPPRMSDFSLTEKNAL